MRPSSRSTHVSPARERRAIVDLARPASVITADDEMLFADPAPPEPDRVGLVVATSGTAGRPKLVELSRPAVASALGLSFAALVGGRRRRARTVGAMGVLPLARARRRDARADASRRVRHARDGARPDRPRRGRSTCTRCRRAHTSRWCRRCCIVCSRRGPTSRGSAILLIGGAAVDIDPGATPTGDAAAAAWCRRTVSRRRAAASPTTAGSSTERERADRRERRHPAARAHDRWRATGTTRRHGGRVHAGRLAAHGRRGSDWSRTAPPGRRPVRRGRSGRAPRPCGRRRSRPRSATIRRSRTSPWPAGRTTEWGQQVVAFVVPVSATIHADPGGAPRARCRADRALQAPREPSSR